MSPTSRSYEPPAATGPDGGGLVLLSTECEVREYGNSNAGTRPEACTLVLPGEGSPSDGRGMRDEDGPVTPASEASLSDPFVSPSSVSMGLSPGPTAKLCQRSHTQPTERCADRPPREHPADIVLKSPGSWAAKMEFFGGGATRPAGSFNALTSSPVTQSAPDLRMLSALGVDHQSAERASSRQRKEAAVERVLPPGYPKWAKILEPTGQAVNPGKKAQQLHSWKLSDLRFNVQGSKPKGEKDVRTCDKERKLADFLPRGQSKQKNRESDSTLSEEDACSCGFQGMAPVLLGMKNPKGSAKAKI